MGARRSHDLISTGRANSEATVFGDLKSKRSWSAENPECALDISFPRKNLPSLFNAFPTQSLSTMPAFKTLASSVQMWSGPKRSLIFNLSMPRPAPNITNSNLKPRAKQTETSSKTKNPNMGLSTLRCKTFLNFENKRFDIQEH